MGQDKEGQFEKVEKVKLIKAHSNQIKVKFEKIEILMYLI